MKLNLTKGKNNMFDTTAKQILNYYKKEFNITNKNIIMEDLQRQIEYHVMFIEKREKFISKLEKKIKGGE